MVNDLVKTALPDVYQVTSLRTLCMLLAPGTHFLFLSFCDNNNNNSNNNNNIYLYHKYITSYSHTLW